MDNEQQMEEHQTLMQAGWEGLHVDIFVADEDGPGHGDLPVPEAAGGRGGQAGGGAGAPGGGQEGGGGQGGQEVFYTDCPVVASSLLKTGVRPGMQGSLTLHVSLGECFLYQNPRTGTVNHETRIWNDLLV